MRGDTRLQSSGRFAYSSQYIHHLADSTGWKILAEQPTQLRRERDGWIKGELWVVQWQDQLPVDTQVVPE